MTLKGRLQTRGREGFLKMTLEQKQKAKQILVRRKVGEWHLDGGIRHVKKL